MSYHSWSSGRLWSVEWINRIGLFLQITKALGMGMVGVRVRGRVSFRVGLVFTPSPRKRSLSPRRPAGGIWVAWLFDMGSCVNVDGDTKATLSE